jgi:hypothetical protein
MSAEEKTTYGCARFFSWEQICEMLRKWADTPEMRAANARVSAERGDDNLAYLNVRLDLDNKPGNMQVLVDIVEKYQKPEDGDGYDLEYDVCKNGDTISSDLSNTMSQHILEEILAAMPDGMLAEKVLAVYDGVAILGEPLGQTV